MESTMLKTCWDSSGSSSLWAPSTTRTTGLRLWEKGPEWALLWFGDCGEGEKGTGEVRSVVEGLHQGCVTPGVQVSV